jgi:hypothetical protein
LTVDRYALKGGEDLHIGVLFTEDSIGRASSAGHTSLICRWQNGHSVSRVGLSIRRPQRHSNEYTDCDLVLAGIRKAGFLVLFLGPRNGPANGHFDRQVLLIGLCLHRRRYVVDAICTPQFRV